jgi:hypothetical protein
LLVTRGHRPERHFAENPSGTGKLPGTSGHRPKVARAFVLFGSSLSVCCLFGFLVVVCLLVGLFACSVFGCLSVWLFVGVFFSSFCWVFVLPVVGSFGLVSSSSVCGFVCLFVRLVVCRLFGCLFGWLAVCLFGGSFVRSSVSFVCLFVGLFGCSFACLLFGWLFVWLVVVSVGRFVGCSFVRLFVCSFVLFLWLLGGLCLGLVARAGAPISTSP